MTYHRNDGIDDVPPINSARAVRFGSYSFPPMLCAATAKPVPSAMRWNARHTHTHTHTLSGAHTITAGKNEQRGADLGYIRPLALSPTVCLKGSRQRPKPEKYRDFRDNVWRCYLACELLRFFGRSRVIARMVDRPPVPYPEALQQAHLAPECRSKLGTYRHSVVGSRSLVVGVMPRSGRLGCAQVTQL